MSDDQLDDTQASPPAEGAEEQSSANPQPEPAPADPADPKPPKRKRRIGRWVLAVLLGLLVFIALGALGGYQAGIGARQRQEDMQSAVEAVAQYELGLADMQAGRCDIARQRFQYVIELNPSYPNAAAMLAESMLCSSGTPEPAAEEVIVEATPTPDLRGADEIYNTTQALLNEQNWSSLLDSLDTLRKNYPDYQPLEVDRMYYLSYRNRGAARILNEGDLEGGIFDLNRAEKIGPLDAQANNYRQWAIWYIIGQSFWEVDWGQAVAYFELVAPQAPNLHGGQFITSEQRLATAQVEYAGDLIEEALRLGNLGGWCEASQLLDRAGQYSQEPVDPQIQPTLDWIRTECDLNPNQIAETPTPGSN